MENPLCNFIANLGDEEIRWLLESPTLVPELMGLIEHLPYCNQCKQKADRVALLMLSGD